MLRKAHEYMKEVGASFVLTGEVLQQRPMSQNKRAIDIIEQESGLAGLILRPLSAKLFSPTIPEQKGWVDREKLLDISGRSRRRQLSLTSELSVSGYSCPAGGCLLTDASFADKVRDLIKSDMFNLWTVSLLRNGRYHRLSDGFKLVVGRKQEENERLLSMARPENVIFEPLDNGPTALGIGTSDSELLSRAGQIFAYYFRQENDPVRYRQRLANQKSGQELSAQGVGEEEVVAVRM